MTQGTDAALTGAVTHYLARAGHVLARIEEAEDPAALMAVTLAPDGFDTGFHLAVAIQFAARALCLPVGAPVPEIAEPCTLATLRTLHSDVTEAVAKAPATDWTAPVHHQAGDAQLSQTAADYVARFALPNMLFHLTMAYAGLRHAGLAIGKADFDGLHAY
ncbi:DUF1993 family protein [Pseudaestuariivita sp.]|uniref:DUF1993 family protein n=1 Tax=Pseudaestuariivita sp. TaxID=2211669 RepID=UPI0040585511